MADNKDTKTAPASASGQNMPSMQLIAQYVKDSSFENPHIPESLTDGWPAPETNVQIGISHRLLKDNIYESAVSFRVEAKNTKDNKVTFIIDLHYAAMVALTHIPQENIHPILMVEVPKLIFPFMREIVADMTAKGGFPPLYLAPVNFEQMYIEQMKRLKEEQDKKVGNA